MARPNMKSVRLSNEALAIVNDAPGEGFNDKFEKLIFSYKNTIPTRQAQLEAIEKRIERKQKDLQKLSELESQVNTMIRQMQQIAQLIPSVSKAIKSVSQNFVLVKPAEDDSEIQRYQKAFRNFTAEELAEEGEDEDMFL